MSEHIKPSLEASQILDLKTNIEGVADAAAEWTGDPRIREPFANFLNTLADLDIPSFKAIGIGFWGNGEFVAGAEGFVDVAAFVDYEDTTSALPTEQPFYDASIVLGRELGSDPTNENPPVPIILWTFDLAGRDVDASQEDLQRELDERHDFWVIVPPKSETMERFILTKTR